MDLNLQGKLALVSASTSGIGYAIAHQLLEDGASVIINGRSNVKVEETTAQLNAIHPGNRAYSLVADMTLQGSEKIAAKKFPDIDILVNSLGTYNLKDFFSSTDQDWTRMFEINVLSGVRLARTYMKGMLERGHGRIIFISSECAVTPMESMELYCASKAALLSLARGLANLTKGTTVTVNTVIPGPTETDSLKGFIEATYPDLSYADKEAELRFLREKRPHSLINRLAQPSEVANVVTFLSSGRASVMNGSIIRAEGGDIPTVA